MIDFLQELAVLHNVCLENFGKHQKNILYEINAGFLYSVLKMLVREFSEKTNTADMLVLHHAAFAAGIYSFKVNSGNARPMCEICSKLLIKTHTTLMTSFWCFIVNFKHISHIVLVCSLLTCKCRLD